jgi:opacity protein-like surface antigen
MKAILFAAASALALSATAASAAIVCNDEGECWHRNGEAKYGPDLRLTVHPDNWKWAQHEKYKWREHGGHGYWGKGVWIEIK